MPFARTRANAATASLWVAMDTSSGWDNRVCQRGQGASIAEKLEHRLADRERCGEARGLDAEEIDEARDAVVGRALDEEIARRLAARLELGPDSGIRGLQGAVREARPVAAYGAVEGRRALRVDVVVDSLDPFDVGTETRLAREIEGQVHSETGGLGRGVDQPGKRRAARKPEVIALAVVLRRDAFRGKSLDAARNILGEQAGAVYDAAREQAYRLPAAHFQLDCSVHDVPGEERAAERDRGALRLGLAAQSEHERVAVHDPRRRRLQRRDTGELRLQRAGFARRK